VHKIGTTEFRTEATVYKPYGERVPTTNLTIATILLHSGCGSHHAALFLSDLHLH